MIPFPTTFDNHLTSLPIGDMGESGAEAATLLNSKDYEVRYGLTPEFADAITTMSQEPSILEYCPKDSGERFTDQAATESWLSKGRANFLLLKKEENDSLSLAGYGWAGPGTSAHAPGGETTFAVRIGEAGQGQGLAAPFSWLIVAGTAAIYGASNFWLETWASNGGAVHVYHKIGFQDVAQEPSTRPTASGGQVDDSRMYMTLPNEKLPTAT